MSEADRASLENARILVSRLGDILNTRQTPSSGTIPGSATQYSTPSSATQYSTPSSATQYSTPSSATQYSTPSSATQYSTPSSATQYSTPSFTTQYQPYQATSSRPSASSRQTESEGTSHHYVLPNLSSGSLQSQSQQVRAYQAHQQLFGYQKRKSSYKAGLEAKRKKLVVWNHTFVCLANVDDTVVPSDYSLLAANGLGKAKIELFESSNAIEIHEAILSTFPKLKEAGGYELLRTHANTKSLSVIFSPPEGYTGYYLKSVLGQAKCFIRPIQADLKISYSPTIEIPESVPRVECNMCKEKIPMIILREHCSNCVFGLEEKSDDIQDSSPLHTHTSSVSEDEFQNQFPRVSFSDVDITPSESVIQNVETCTLESIICDIKKKYQITIPLDFTEYDDLFEENRILRINIRRNLFMEDLLKEGRSRKFDPTKILKVTFVGEEGVDVGGVRREFWQLMFEQVGTYFLKGDDGKMAFIQNTLAFQRNELKIVGMFVAMSIVQEGFGLPLFHSIVYDYFTTGKYVTTLIRDDDVPDEKVKNLIAQMNDCKCTEELRGVLDIFYDCLCDTGYRKPLNRIVFEDCREIIEMLKTHCLKSTIPEMDQFCEGLRALDVLDYIRMYPDVMRQLFVEDEEYQLTAQSLIELFDIEYSCKESVERRTEEETYNRFKKFLEDCEAHEITSIVINPITLEEVCRLIELKHVLIFFTATSRIIPCGFEKKPRLLFSHQEILLTSSTCDLSLTLPTKYYNNQSLFNEKLVLSITSAVGFGKL